MHLKKINPDGLYSAIAKSMVSRYAVYAVNLLSMMVLARIFSPQDYGTVAAVMVFFIFFQLMAEAGLGPAIININQLKKSDRDGLFGLTILVGTVLALLFASLAPVFVLFYELPGVGIVVPYVAISLFFFSVNVVPNALLLRDKAFYRIGVAGLIAEIVSLTITIALANLVNPIHALAAKGTVSAGTLLLTIWYFSGKTEFGRPLPGRKFSAIKPLLKFSTYQFFFNFINYFSRNLDNILVGRYMGVAALGIYDKAYQLMKYPLILLTFAMTPAIQPVIRKYADDQTKAEEIHQSFTFRLSLLGAAAGLLMFLLADWIILIALGNQWVDVIPIIRILAMAIPVQVILSTSGSFFQAMSRTDLLFLSGALSAVVMVAAIITGIVMRDIESLCWFLVVAFHINFIQTYYILYKKVFFKPVSSFFIKTIPSISITLGICTYLFFSVNK
ncbi:lipopolysaccharide biosynthesis protein [Orrella marina]|uniref:Uncharacterized protein n=1 Tax=Orrella marina TaxID=2163011 RepID=A0A2R4XGT2_9BURK|nr:lipopolysaccharide biosynthesis protein [Orrella marina]AWB33038.1 hypothetical protein DBV39_04110 [Orrella marina]